MKLKAKRIILFVKNVPAVAGFYRDVLGLKVKGDSKDKKWIDLDAGGLSIGLHSGGKSSIKKQTTKITFYCADVSAARSYLVEKGAKLSPVKSFGELSFCEGTDPEGNPYQLSNRP